MIKNIYFSKLIVILFLVVSYSCNNKSSVKNELRSFGFKSITIPKDLKCLINGKDTFVNDICKHDLKFIVYADSLECSSCMLKKLNKWDPFMLKNQQKKYNIQYYYIFSVRNIDLVKKIMNSSNFGYPIYIDSLGEFERLNPHLPKNKAMHTFLLDEDNNVILVGNPLQNKQIEKMFYEEVEKRVK